MNRKKSKDTMRQAYAKALRDYIEGKIPQEPKRPDLSVMVIQTVKMQVYDCFPESLLIQKGLLAP